MSSELQRKHQNMDPTAIIEYLKKMVDIQLDIENSLVGPLVNHVIVLAEEHEKLGYKLGKELSEDLILRSMYDDECFHCKKKGYWKRNCKEYLETLKDKKQGFKISTRLKKGEINLQVGNGAKVAAVAVGSISLLMLSGKVLMLDDYYYVHKFVSNIISASMLDNRGFYINIGN
uniref:Uncharacterized protein LOC104231796 n=2 Tax=Nicotiana sylvestris TaxID=4096 RepID=A0A1U7X0G1_NICSY